MKPLFIDLFNRDHQLSLIQRHCESVKRHFFGVMVTFVY